ncbi:MAG: hypothetical protein WCX17_04770 [Parcubacteria group bacterium]
MLIFTAVFFFIVALYPFKILIVKSPVKVLNPIVQQGDVVFTEMEYTQNTTDTSEVVAQVKTAAGSVIASHIMGLKLEQGTHKKRVGFVLPRQIKCPKNEKYIKARLEITSKYIILGFRRISISYCTEEFKIVAKE